MSRDPILFVATGFGAGLVPRAPGTAGSVIGLALALVLAFMAPSGEATIIATALAALVAFVVGIPVCARAARRLGDPDPSAIVWDEVTGMLVTVIALPAGWHWWLTAFALFRAFDIVKPWPVRWLERRVGGGAGIMLDDVAAGALAWLAVQGLAYALPASFGLAVW